MNKPGKTASSMTPVNESDGEADDLVALDKALPRVSVDAENLTPEQQVLVQHAKQMTWFLR